MHLKLALSTKFTLKTISVLSVSLLSHFTRRANILSTIKCRAPLWSVMLMNATDRDSASSMPTMRRAATNSFVEDVGQNAQLVTLAKERLDDDMARAY